MYSPLLSAVRTRVRPVPSLTMVTFAPATVAPVESVTVPRMVPLTDCAAADAARPRLSATTHRVRPSAELVYLIISPPLYLTERLTKATRVKTLCLRDCEGRHISYATVGPQ